MASDTPQFSQIPWVSSLLLNGKGPKPASGLTVCDDFVYDFNGAKRRRGGQLHAHRIPFREGRALSEHFLDQDKLHDRGWVTNRLVEEYFEEFYFERSVIRGAFHSSTARFVDHSLFDVAGDEVVPYLVQSSPTSSQIDVARITFRARFEDLPATADGGWTVSVDPGKPGDGSTAEWLLIIKFASDGIFILNESGSMEDVQAQSGVTNHLTASATTDYIDTEWHNWRFDVTRLADTGGPVRHYIVSVYLEEVLIYSSFDIENASTASADFSMLWAPKIAGGSSCIVEVDHVEVIADSKAIHEMADYTIPQDEIVTKFSRAAVFVGDRAYVDHGDTVSMQCIDDELTPDELRDAVVFRGKLIYPAGGKLLKRPRIFTLADWKAEELWQAPPGNLLQVHAKRLWSAGNPTKPSRLSFSELNNETFWAEILGGGYIDVEPDDGQRIMGIAPSYHGDLIIYKTKGIYRIQGTGPSSFVLNQIHAGDVGCASHLTIKNVGNDQLFMSEVGVHSLLTTQKYGDIERTYMSWGVRDFWDQKVNKEALFRARAVNNRKFDRYELMVPTYAGTNDGNVLDRTLVLHYALQKEAFPNGAWSMKSIEGAAFAMLRRAGQPEYRAYVGGTDGFMNLQDQQCAFDFPVAAA